MLVLSRMKDQRIIIGDGEAQVTITVVAVRGNKVRLGIDAPRDVAVHRQEVLDAIKRNAAADDGDTLKVELPS